MDASKISITFSGMESSDALRDYALNKLTKHENLLQSMISGEIVMSSDVSKRGNKSDFRIDINYDITGKRIHVDEVGNDMYALIDSVSDKLFRRLKRFNDKQQQWDGSMPWKVAEAENELSAMEAGNGEIDRDNYLDYIPQIKMRKKLVDMRPVYEAEAIELMELGGYSQYLFRNAENENKVCMVYKHDDGTYGIVEPSDL